MKPKRKKPAPKDAKPKRARFRPAPLALEGDAETPLKAPCTADVLLSKVLESLKEVAHPDIPGRPIESEEDRNVTRLVFASKAMMELWEWIRDHASSGNLAAQSLVFENALATTNDFLACANRELPAIKKTVRSCMRMPGFVSTDPQLMAEMLQLCRSLGQGREYPFPLDHKAGRKQEAKITTAHHALVNELWAYMESHRQHGQWLMPLLRGRVTPIYAAMLTLPPLSPESWKQWRDLADDVLKSHTGGEPLAHPAFRSDGIFAALASHDVRGEPLFRRRMADAWRFRAERMNALPPSSEIRTSYSSP